MCLLFLTCQLNAVLNLWEQGNFGENSFGNNVVVKGGQEGNAKFLRDKGNAYSLRVLPLNQVYKENGVFFSLYRLLVRSTIKKEVLVQLNKGDK